MLSTSGFGEERYFRIDEDIVIVTSFQERYRKFRVSDWKYEGILEFPQEVQVVYMLKSCLWTRYQLTKIEQKVTEVTLRLMQRRSNLNGKAILVTLLNRRGGVKTKFYP